MNIQSMPKSKLRQNEWLDTCRAIESKINEAGAETLGVASTFATFQAKLQAYDESIVKLTKSLLTGQMKESDKERDNCQTGLLDQIRVNANHFNPTKREMGQRLLVIADRFRNTTQLSYNDQTGMVRNLIQALRTDDAAADVEGLGLTEWVDQLETINETCATLSNERRMEKGARNQPLKAKETRPELDKAYDALVDRLNALALVNGEEKYADLFVWWNAMIDEFRIAISLRSGKGKGGQTDNGESNQPNPDAGSGEQDGSPGDI